MSDLLSIALPDSLTFSVVFDRGSEPNSSYFDATITDVEGTDNIFEGLVFDAYCIDTDRNLPLNTDFKATVYSSYEALPTELIGPGLIEKPENLDLVNWILNQGFVGKTASTNDVFTSSDLQRAIWELTDDEQATGGLGGPSQWDQARVDEIINLAIANGEDFVPTYEYTTIFGEEVVGKLGVILVPDRNGDIVPEKQIIIITVDLEPDIEIEKLVNGFDADTEAEAVEIAANDNAIFTYEVTNTGNVSFAADEVVVTDDNGTPDDTGDDFNPDQVLDSGFNVGDTNTNNHLDPGETWLYTKTVLAEDLSTTTTTIVNNVIDFNTDGLGNPLSAGTVIDDEYANLGVTISATGGSDQAMIFDSANPTGGDDDLATPSEGNILIISEDGDSNDPDDNAGGGTITFTFNNGVNVNSLSFVDIEESGGQVITTDSDNNVSITSIPALGDNSLQALSIDDDDVVEIKVEFVGSGSVSGLDFDSIETEITPGIYHNIGKVVTDTVEDADPANYVNPDPNPGVEIQKLTNGIDADLPEDAVEIAVGDTVTWTYEVTNTGNTFLLPSDIVINDDNGTPDDPGDDFSTTDSRIVLVPTPESDDGIFSPGETWIYEASAIAQNLTESSTDSLTLLLTGNSNLDGSDGNIRTFSAGDVSVKSSAFSRTDAGIWDEAFLGAFSSGLGVTDTSEGNGGNGLHRVDNVSRDNYVLFEFSESVIVDRTFLDSVVNDSDISVWIGSVDDPFNNHNILSDSFLDSLEFTEDNNTRSSNSRWADINNGEVAGNVLVIAASTSDPTPEDRFKIRKLDIQQVESGIYHNLGTVEIPGATDSDPSNYVNPTPNPDIDIEKFTNDIDVDLDDLPEIAPGDDVTFSYEVTNIGNIPFDLNDIVVTDDNGTPDNTNDDFNPSLDPDSDLGADGVLSPGETWLYASETEAAQDLSSSTSEDLRFIFTGNSSLDGPDGNVRSFSEGDVSVEVSAFSKKNGTWNDAYLGAYSGGLGVTNKYESGSSHRVDNGGSVDYLLFEFDNDITVDRAFLDSVGSDSDISYWIGDRNGDISSLDDSLLSSFDKGSSFTSSSGDRWADINSDQLSGDTLIISAYTGGSNDSFKLKKLDISAFTGSNSGSYLNIGTVTAGSVTDSDISGYINPEIV